MEKPLKKKSDQRLKLDLHKMTRDEAKAALITLLDQALIKNIHLLEIIHGHGKGTIKMEVEKFLQASPYVASFHLMDRNSGTTIAHLK